MSEIKATGFAGAYRDPISRGYPLGNGYRWYLPGLLRFNSPDESSPFGIGGPNAYAYCGDDPINRLDPSGHGFFSAIGRSFRSMMGTATEFQGEQQMARSEIPIAASGEIEVTRGVDGRRPPGADSPPPSSDGTGPRGPSSSHRVERHVTQHPGVSSEDDHPPPYSEEGEAYLPPLPTYEQALGAGPANYQEMLASIHDAYLRELHSLHIEMSNELAIEFRRPVRWVGRRSPELDRRFDMLQDYERRLAGIHRRMKYERTLFTNHELRDDLFHRLRSAVTTYNAYVDGYDSQRLRYRR